MNSSSSSSSNSSTYDVFSNFRGVELVGSIKECKISIVVFSRNYEASSWCLEKLVKMIMECKRSVEHMVLPISYEYDVDPSDMRQKATFAKPFKNHEERFSSDSAKLLLWRKTLPRWDLRNTVHGNEGELIINILEEGLRKLKNTNLSVAPSCVRINFHLQAGKESIETLGLCLKTKAFEELRLRLSQHYHVQLTGCFEHLSKQLRSFLWIAFPLNFTPNKFYLGNISGMSLKYGNLTQAWKPSKFLDKLTLLDLSHSHNLTHTPELSLLPHLKKLVLDDCKSLCEVHHSIGNLERLVLVNLNGCKNLKNLPKSFYKLKSLETLILFDCSMFDHLDEGLGEMVSLDTFLVANTRIRKIPLSIERLTNLRKLYLCGLKRTSSKTAPSLLQSSLRPRKNTKSVNLLPPSFQGLNSLRYLSLYYYNLRDDDIPKDIGSLLSLTTLNLRGNSFHGLPSLRSLSNLYRLTLDDCRMLEFFQDLPINLSNLSTKNCVALQRLSNNMSEIVNLDILDITNCHNLVDISFLNERRRFIRLKMQGCYSIPTSFKDKFLKDMMVNGAITEIVLTGNDIPEWLPHISEGSNPICFQVPQTLKYTLREFILCISFSLLPNEIFLSPRSISMVNNMKGTSALCVESFYVTHFDLERVGKGHLYFTSLYHYGSDVENGDQIEVILDRRCQSVTYNKIGV